jgi:hypothetical protein
MKLTRQQRASIIALHQAGKREECERLCVKLGVRVDYARVMASKLGLPPKYRTSPLCREVPNDPRWERARRVGMVVV